MTLETSKCSDFFALTFTTKINAFPKGWDVVKHWFLFLRVETHRVFYFKKIVRSNALFVFTKANDGKMPDENLYYKLYNKGLTKIKETVNDLNYSA